MNRLHRMKLERIYGSVVQWVLFLREVANGAHLVIKQAWEKWNG